MGNLSNVKSFLGEMWVLDHVPCQLSKMFFLVILFIIQILQFILLDFLTWQNGDDIIKILIVRIVQRDFRQCHRW